MNIAAAIKLAPVRSKKLDSIFIIGSPFIAFLVVALFCDPRFISGEYLHNPQTPEWFMIAAMLLTYSHIMLVFVRSHLNTDVFRTYPNRFLGIPLIILAVIWSSQTAFAVIGVFALYWDEWHSLMQTFGFGRIYDAKLGNDPTVGRKLDMGMAFVVGLLPHILALTYLPESVRRIGLQENLTLSLELAENYGHYIHTLKAPLIAFGISYTLFYCLSYYKLIKNGYKYSKEKFLLFASTGISATLIVSLYSISDAAYFSNIYHAVQYYFIVYMSEGHLLPKRFGSKKENTRSRIAMYFSIVAVTAVLLGIARAKTLGTFGFLGSFWLLMSLLHFWYDGFIWSVRKQHV